MRYQLNIYERDPPTPETLFTWSHLSIGRDLIDMVFVHDVLTNRINCPDVLNLIGFRTPISNKRHSDLFRVRKFKTECSENSFFTRALFTNANEIAAVLVFFKLISP